MTTPTALTPSDSDGAVRTRSSRSRSFTRIGVAGLVISSVLGSGVIIGTHVAAQSEPGPAATPPSLFVAIEGYRAFDSRTDSTREKIDDDFRVVEVGIGRGRIIIPKEAVAVAYTVTATATEGSGFASVDTFGTTTGSEISTLAWTGPGQRVVNSGIVETFEGDTDGAHLVAVGVGGTDAAAHIIIDVTGYLLPDA